MALEKNNFTLLINKQCVKKVNLDIIKNYFNIIEYCNKPIDYSIAYKLIQYCDKLPIRQNQMYNQDITTPMYIYLISKNPSKYLNDYIYVIDYKNKITYSFDFRYKISNLLEII